MISAYPAGVPTFGAAAIPQLFGSQAQCFFVDNNTSSNGGLGNDGNDGKSPNSPFLTIARGYQALRSGFNDTLFLIGSGVAYGLDAGSFGAGAAGFTWAKNRCHLVGIASPTYAGQQSQVTNGATLMTPLFTVTGSGCVFQNIYWLNAGSHATAALKSVDVQGAACVFKSCKMAGGTGATTAAQTGARSLTLDGAVDCLFEECTVGQTTVAQSAASYTMETLATNNTAARNIFKRCTITRNSAAGGTGGGFLIVAAATIAEYLMFDDCIFANFSAANANPLTTGFSAATALAGGGFIFIKYCTSAGMTGWTGGANTTLVADGSLTAATVGLGLNPSS